MKDLIAALQIFQKYTNKNYPTRCLHDTLIVDVSPDVVSKEDIEKLEELGFFLSSEFPNCFTSFRFGG